MSLINKIRHEFWKEKVLTNYSKKGRYIPQAIYVKLKKKNICQNCGRGKRPHEIFQIHHKIPVRFGGCSNADNLIAVCSDCHKILDNKQKKEKNKSYDT